MTREQLYFSHYAWHVTEAEAVAAARESPDRAPLDRTEGQHVLAFINYLAARDNWEPAKDPRDAKTGERIPASGHKVETMLRTMPGHITDREAAYEWLDATWSTF